MRSVDGLEIKFPVACDVIESVNFAEFHGFYDVTGNFELDFRAIGSLYQDVYLPMYFPPSFFELFLLPR